MESSLIQNAAYHLQRLGYDIEWKYVFGVWGDGFNVRRKGSDKVVSVVHNEHFLHHGPHILELCKVPSDDDWSNVDIVTLDCRYIYVLAPTIEEIMNG